MDSTELDETLKLLIGFNEDTAKRKKIIKSIKEKGRISIFAYGSLLWNPICHYHHFLPNCFLNNYRKGFFSEDFIYRGHSSFTGLTMGLIEDLNSHVNGALFISYGKEIIPFLKSFVVRESPCNANGVLMDIYRYDFLPITLPDGITTEYAITCIANEKSVFYLNNRLTFDEQVKKIGQAYGRNGTNFQYLQNLKIVHHELNIRDSFSQEFEDLCEQIFLFRTGLTIHFQKWFDNSDQFRALEENQQKPANILTNFPNEESNKQTLSELIY